MSLKNSTRVQLNRNNYIEEKTDYANFSQTRIITLFQVPQYEYLQILICNGNSLTTLAGIEHLKHLWKLDVGNNQIRSLQHLSRFIAFGSLILSNNNIPWIELQHIRHLCILDLKVAGNQILDGDSNYRQHILDCLPRIWMCDGLFVSTAERNEIDDFFTQSSFKQKPIRRKLARDIFMPTNLKDRSVNGLFGTKATELFAKFPMNCFVTPDLDKKRIKYLASTVQDLLMTEMKYENEHKTHDEFLTENRHILYHLIDIRQTHIEEFNMFLILLLTDILFQIPNELLDNVLNVTHIKSIGNLNISNIFASSEKLKCSIASLIHAGARIDRDENHPAAFYDKLFNSLSIILTNQIRQLSSSTNTNQTFPNSGLVSEAKSLVCLEVMQVFIMCPSFYIFFENSNVHAILKQALYRSPAYGSIKDVLRSLNADQKTPEEQKDLLGPILGNIIKMTIRTLSTKRVKKPNEPITTNYEIPILENENSNRQTQERSTASPRATQRPNSTRTPAIGDRILTAPQSIGRIITLPDTEIAMIQLDHVLSANGSMVNTGSLNDHTTYVNISNFEWDPLHEYWKPICTSGDKITLQMTTVRNETPRLIIPPQPTPQPLPKVITPKIKTPEPFERGCTTPKLFDMNLGKPKEAFVEPLRDVAPTPSPISEPVINQETTKPSQELPKSPPTTPPTVERNIIVSDEIIHERPMSVRIIKQRQERHLKNCNIGETIPTSPVLIESVLFLVPDRSDSPIISFEQTKAPTSSSTTANDFEPTRIISAFEHSSAIPSTLTPGRQSVVQRVHVPVHNASQWFAGPNMQNERTGRMEKVVAGLVRRSFRPLPTYAMPRVPTLTSPSSRDHALYKGVRPGSFQDFCIESHRMTPAPVNFIRQSQSAKGRFATTMRSHDFSRTNNSNQNIFRAKSLLNPLYSTPS